MTPAQVHAFRAEDAPALASLLREMQSHYGVPCPPDAEILDGLAKLPAGVRLLVAHEAGSAIGFAALAPVWPGPGLRSGLFLKDLFVTASRRGGSAGRALLRAAARLARAEGFARLEWTADRGNARLLALYRGLGAQEFPERLFMRLLEPALERLALE